MLASASSISRLVNIRLTFSSLRLVSNGINPPQEFGGLYLYRPHLAINWLQSKYYHRLSYHLMPRVRCHRAGTTHQNDGRPYSCRHKRIVSGMHLKHRPPYLRDRWTLCWTGRSHSHVEDTYLCGTGFPD